MPASSPVLGEEEKRAMIASIERGWLTAGPINRQFEEALEKFTGIKHVRTCNSGSSANLLAVAAMVEAGYWRPGDEIITVAACFPTTVNPLLLYGLVPVFVDVDLATLNAVPDQVLRAIAPHRTRGIMLAHTLGNPFSEEINDISARYGLPIIEDCCDALGATRGGKHVGSTAALATCSFFPAHQITTGEGGAVFTQNDYLARLVESIRDWGRDCWCAPGQNDTCGKRFDWSFDGLPHGYDHKYTFTHLGFNLKITESQAACGVEQLRRLPSFVLRRRSNAAYLARRLSDLGERAFPSEVSAEASPFGFAITLKEESARPVVQAYLAQEGVDSRLLFAGNITRQPYMRGRKWRVASELRNTDRIMESTFWIGCWPGLTEEQLEYAATKVEAALGVFS